ncbi:alpha/beta fold hydrolase [Cryobacterium frigoriphilum]|nr:alpha/beta hydrolase [Cryobacterium frigoriphilum]
MSTTMTRATRIDASRAPEGRRAADPLGTGMLSTEAIGAGYCPFPISTDPRQFGLTTSTMRLAHGVVVVRHGRRTLGDTATILLHGAAGSWTTWTPLLAAAASGTPASQRHAETDAATLPLTDLIVADLPGWGESALAADPADRTVEALAATVAEVARALGYRRWVVLGHSMGGFVALQLAASEPESTVSVALISPTTFSVIDSVRHPVTRGAALPAYTALLMMMRLLAGLGRVGEALIAGVARLSLLRLLVSPLFDRAARMDATVIAALASEVRPVGFTVASAQAGGYDAAERWSRIVCPVRSVTGDSDVFIAASDAERLRGVIANFETVIMAGAGHFAHIERPFTVLTALNAHEG